MEGDKTTVEGSKQAEQLTTKPGLIETLAENQGAIGGLAQQIGKVVDDYVSKRERHLRALEGSRARFVGRIILAAFLLIGTTVVVTGLLTWYRIVSGEGFAFLTGTLVGSLVTFLGERVAPFLYDVEEDVEA